MATRQTHVAIETRLTMAEAEALRPFLDYFASLAADGILRHGEVDPEHLTSALQKIGQCVEEAAAPFEESGVH